MCTDHANTMHDAALIGAVAHSGERWTIGLSLFHHFCPVPKSVGDPITGRGGAIAAHEGNSVVTRGNRRGARGCAASPDNVLREKSGRGEFTRAATFRERRKVGTATSHLTGTKLHQSPGTRPRRLRDLDDNTCPWMCVLIDAHTSMYPVEFLTL